VTPAAAACAAIRSSSEGDWIVPGQIALQRHEVHRHRFGQADHRRLARPVSGPVRHALHRGGGGSHVDDRAPAPLQHARKESLDQVEHRRDIEVERKFPRPVVAVEDRPRMHITRAVEQDIEAPDLGRRLGDRLG
jgi:hypothetical protein